MQDTVQDSGGNGDVGKNLVPLGEGFVGSEDSRRLFIPSGNKLEEKIGALYVHGEVADLVDLALINGGLKGKVKVIQGFLGGETGHLDLLFINPFPLGFCLF